MQRYSTLFGKTNKSAKEYDSVNATLLQKAGFIDQVISGAYAMLPLGLRVLEKIENVVREEMDAIGSEMLMTTLSSPELWKQTGRLDEIDVLMKATAANSVASDQHSGEYIVNPTHEDVITYLVQKKNLSYKDFPFAVYQIQTKFRNEPRAKSGLLRGREFRMKDLYSFSRTEEERKEFYEQSKEVYARTYEKLALGEHVVMAKASGGDFTDEYSHEFQAICETGEDVIYIHEESGEAWNKEIAPQDALDGSDAYRVVNASEVGNIFPLGTKFSDALGLTYADENGDVHPVVMGSYGIGTTRLMGVMVELFHDDNGIIWPEEVAPYDVHLLVLDEDQMDDAMALAERIETETGKEVLVDDRMDKRPGEKFADADLIGIPWRAVAGRRAAEAGGFEVKRRDGQEAKVVSDDDLVKMIG